MAKQHSHHKYSVIPEKKHGGIEEDASQHLWAVSYTDLLMVLLTFFVIYFRFDDVQVPTPKALQEVATELSEKQKYEAAPVEGVPADAVKPAPHLVLEKRETASEGTAPGEAKKGNGVPESLLSQLKKADLGVDLIRTPDDIIVNLPPNFYGSGQFKPNKGQKKELTRLLGIIKPFSKELSIVFIGHTDTKPVGKKFSKLIDTNLGLSTLRAVRAVEHALTMGFDPRWISTQGVGEYDRSSRSLSIKLIARSTP